MSEKRWMSGKYIVFVCLWRGFTAQSTQWGVISSVVSLPNHTFIGQAYSSRQLTSIIHILSPETDNCPFWVSWRERMMAENTSWSISTKECCLPQWVEPATSWSPVGHASNWDTEAGKQCRSWSDTTFWASRWFTWNVKPYFQKKKTLTALLGNCLWV